MKGRQTQSRPQEQGQKQNWKAKGNSNVKNEPGKAIQKSKMDNRETEKRSTSEPLKLIDSKGKVQKTDSKMDPGLEASCLEETGIKSKNPDKKPQKVLEASPLSERAQVVVSDTLVKPKSYDSFAIEQKSKEKSNESKDDYITPRRWKVRPTTTKPEENVGLRRSEISSSPNTIMLQKSLEKLKLNSGDTRDNKVDSSKSAWKSEKYSTVAGQSRAGPYCGQEKASNTTSGAKAKIFSKPLPTAPTIPRDESSGLVKQPTVVSVTSTRRDPKVTYASKVKQNLYETKKAPLPRVSHSESDAASGFITAVVSPSATIQFPKLPDLKPSNDPKTVVKPVNSPDFASGSKKKVHVQCTQGLPLETSLIRHPSSDPNPVKKKAKSNLPIADSVLHTYPVVMPVAPKGPKPAMIPLKTKIQTLTDVFQNEWGLSFITEPLISPDVTTNIPRDPEVTEPPLLPGSSKPLDSQETKDSPCGAAEPVLVPKHDLKESFKAEGLGNADKPVGPVKAKKALKVKHTAKGEPTNQVKPKSKEPLKLLPSNEEMEKCDSPGSLLVDPTVEDEGKKIIWDPLNAKAAVEYHINEMKDVWDMYKKDPTKLVIYDESIDSSKKISK